MSRSIAIDTILDFLNGRLSRDLPHSSSRTRRTSICSHASIRQWRRKAKTSHSPFERIRAGIVALFERPAEGYYLIAEDAQGTPAGALMLTFEWSDWRNGRFWWIQSVYVTPGNRRRKGVYSALHEHVRNAARADPEVVRTATVRRTREHRRSGDVPRDGHGRNALPPLRGRVRSST